MQYWKLDGTDVIACTIAEWTEIFKEPGSRHVIAQHRTTFRGEEILLSTIFIGYGDYPFESMLFAGGKEQASQRWASYEEAVDNHNWSVQELEHQLSVKLTQEVKALEVSDDE